MSIIYLNGHMATLWFPRQAIHLPANENTGRECSPHYERMKSRVADAPLQIPYKYSVIHIEGYFELLCGNSEESGSFRPEKRAVGAQATVELSSGVY
jgi:hypothetical protein